MGDVGCCTRQGVEVVPVRDARGLREFIRLPWSIYRGDPNWVPPLVSAMKKQFDARHPFFEHGEMQLFTARRAGRTVGRLAAIVNHLHNSYHNEKAGFWGFFDCENDQATADALFKAAGEWLAGKGMADMRGPFNPSINSECGMLIDGFDRPPVLMMPYNPRYYPALVEAAGFKCIQNLQAYRLEQAGVSEGQETRQRLDRLAAAIAKRHPEIVIRPLDMTRYEQDVIELSSLFNDARKDNWGFVPSTDAELRLMAKEMKMIVEPGVVLVAEVRGEKVGCVIGIPDVNPLLQKMNGRLLPFGWLHLLRGRKRLHSLRVLGSACLPRYRHLGIIAVLFDRFICDGLALGYDEAELSWISEANVASVRTLESAFKPTLYKQYRVYSRPV